MDPLIDIQHKRQHPKYLGAIAAVTTQQEAGLSYNMSVYFRAGKGLQFNPKAYYNTKCSSKIPVTAEERINKMLYKLTAAGFHPRS